MGCAYHTFLRSLLDLLDFVLGQAFDLEQRLGQAAVHRLGIVSAHHPYQAFRWGEVLPRQCGSCSASTSGCPTAQFLARDQLPRSVMKIRYRLLTVVLQLVDVDDVRLVLQHGVSLAVSHGRG